VQPGGRDDRVTVEIQRHAQSSGFGRDGLNVQPPQRELTCKVPLPFVSLVAGAFTDGVTIREVASARSAVSPVTP